MNKTLWIIGMMLTAFCACGLSEQGDKPAFKGMELYSWSPVERGWYFNILPGTNRNKTMEEITAPENTIAGVDALKAKLALLPKGERVSWRNLANEPVPLDILNEIRTFCREHDIILQEL